MAVVDRGVVEACAGWGDVARLLLVVISVSS